MRVLVTGAAGFVGSNMVDRLLDDGQTVVGYDNLSTGQARFLDDAKRSPRFEFVSGDVLDEARLQGAMSGCDLVVHLAANADIRHGLQRPRQDLEQNTIATFNVLEAMRANKVGRLAFSSTGSVYGEPTVFPTPENAPFPVQTSLYAASKVAGEALISAYCEGFGIQAFIFRFVSILGQRYTHGHVFDFVGRLRADPTELHVLGNGRQNKSYLHVDDCVEAMLVALARADDRVNILNLGTDETCQVQDSIGWITERLGLQPRLVYSGGERGWVGDSPYILLDCSRIKALGWRAKLTVREAVIRTVDYLRDNPWVYGARP